MKHFRDLKYSEFIEFLTYDSFVAEKIDGSCFRFGIDSEGFYTAAKGSKKYRCQDDYNQYWHNDYRAAHIVVEKWWEKYSYRFPNHLEITAEIVACNRPNAILYEHTKNTIFITTDLSPYGVFEDFIFRDYLLTYLNITPFIVYTEVTRWLEKIKNNYENLHVDTSLNKKLPSNTTKEEILKNRLTFKQDLTRVSVFILKDTRPLIKIIGTYNLICEPCYSEGIVVTYGKNADKQFKITFPNFTMMNEYYHKWHEKIISKKYDLDELLAKYLKNPYNDLDVHTRTLLLFSEERKRLQNGW